MNRAEKKDIFTFAVFSAIAGFIVFDVYFLIF